MKAVDSLADPVDLVARVAIDADEPATPCAVNPNVG